MEMSSLIWMQGNVDIRCVNYGNVRAIGSGDLRRADRRNEKIYLSL